jgi:translation initiation factor 5
MLNLTFFKLYIDLNPAAQGSSLTEGKRGKRSKKANGESNGTNGTEDGGRSYDNDSSDHVVEAPDKLANENVSIVSLIST